MSDVKNGSKLAKRGWVSRLLMYDIKVNIFPLRVIPLKFMISIKINHIGLFKWSSKMPHCVWVYKCHEKYVFYKYSQRIWRSLV